MLTRPICAAYLRGKLPTRDPFCFGHEFVADVVAVGDEVAHFVPGNRVIVSFLIACGTCRRCLQGYPAACLTVPSKSAYGFGIFGDWGGAACDLIRVPYASTMMALLPDGISVTDAASAGDNLSDAFRCVADGLEEEPGAPVLIVAGGGGAPSISLYAAALAMSLGSEQVDYMDSDRERLTIAEAIGANPIEAKSPPKRHGSYWITADTSGHPSGDWLATALNSTAPYGRCTSCGIYHGVTPVPLGAMYRQGVRFTIGWANIQSLMPRVLNLLAAKAVALSKIHNVVPWDDAIAALKDPPPKLIFVRNHEAAAGRQ
ncbi:MAG: alcohol dehydrogenase catalytic domain-containing protein [Sphingomonas sp.]|nr:alcohol dehydrogenase catalytic domain-containing protein [Sphingomonas sp.]